MFKLNAKIIIVCFILLGFNTNLAADGNEPFYIGFFPYISANRIVKDYKPLAQYLEQQLSRVVIIVSAPSFKQFNERTEKQNYDVIFTAPHFAYRAEKRGSYQRLFRFEDKLVGYVFVAADSAIDSVSALKSKVVALPDRLAIISSLGEVYLNQQGFVENENLFLLHTSSHNNAAMAVLNKKASAGIIARPVFKMFNRKNPGKLKLLTKTEAIPGAMFMLKSNLPEMQKQNITRAFTQFPESIYGKAFFNKTPFSGITSIKDQDMRLLEKYLDVIEKYL